VIEPPRLSSKSGLSLIERHEVVEIARVDSGNYRFENLLRRSSGHTILPGPDRIINNETDLELSTACGSDSPDSVRIVGLSGQS
jgi:hypothetical protein